MPQAAAEFHELSNLRSSYELDTEQEIRESLLHQGSDQVDYEAETMAPKESGSNAATDMDEMVLKTTPQTDDPSLPSLTFRSVLLGSVFCILGATASQIFYFKSNSPSFSVYFVILVSYPLGNMMAKYMPRRLVMGVDTNPGKFNIKEHLLVAVIASSGGTSAYASDIIAILRLYYHETIGAIQSITLLITTQVIGFGLAGMLQEVLIKPTSMYWPASLVLIQLFNTLHDTSTSLTKARLNLFIYVFTICFVYQFLPGTFFPTLTSIATLCYVNNRSWLMRVLGSGYEGLGMLNFSLDWATIGYNGPLYTPWNAQLNWFTGIILMVWVIAPIMLAVNFWNARDFPSPTSSHLYNATFQSFDVTSVLNKDLSLNETAWDEVRPLLLTPYFAVSYAVSFAALTAVLAHVWIWHRHEVYNALAKRTKHSDVHNILMGRYDPVPNAWYLGTLALTLAAAILLVESSPLLQTPVWMLLLAVLIAGIFLAPIGIITAVSNTTIGLNVLTEFIAGILMPGKPIGNVLFKCYGYMAMSQAIALLGDQKLAHYMHVRPKDMFVSQALGTGIGCIVNYIVLTQVIETKRQYLDGSTVDPTGQWNGRKPAIFYSASVIWGLIAPRRFFAGQYSWLYLGFPIGGFLPFVFFWLHRKYPGRYFDQVIVPVIMDGAQTVPQAPSNIILTSFFVALSANVWLRKWHPRFHGNFIYVISSALDAGTSLQALTSYVLLAAVFSSKAVPAWWGNSALDTEHCIPGS